MPTVLAPADSQADRAADILATQIQPLDTNDDPNTPQTPFPTSLILSREQEDKMVEYALNYIDNLELEMGRIVQPAGPGTTSVPDETTFMGRREKWTMRYYNHVEDRPMRANAELFKQSNITATLSQRIAMQMIARSNSFFFGTTPWYSCNFVGIEDKPLSERIDRHSKWKFEMTGLQATLEAATEFAFVRGEAVVKTIYQTKDRIFKRKGRVMFDAATQQPVLDSLGNFVFDRDAWENQMAPEPIPPEAIASGQPVIPQMIPTGREVLRRDRRTLKPAMVSWQDGNWPMKNRIFEGPECKLVYFKDFLCPLSAPDIHEAELICHLYDMPVMSLVQMFQREDLKAQGAADSFDSLKKAVEAIRNLTGEGVDFKASAGQARSDHGEQYNEGSPENPLCETAEVYLTYDADGDGMAEEIMLVLDRKNRFPLFYDYLDNVCVRGRRPFEVIRPKAIDGRWYGMGAMEYFEPEQEFIDLCLNRRNFRMSQAGRVTFWNPSVTVEGQANPHLKLNNGKTYRLREGFRAEDALGYVVLPEEGADLMELLNFFMQLMQLKSGIINAGDQEQSGMPTSETATGIRNVEKSGQEMFAQFLSTLRPGHRAALLANIRVLYYNLSQQEMFRFFDDGSGQEASGVISPEEVADLDFDVTILLTRVRTEQVLEMSAAARGLIVEFYNPVAIPPQVQPVVAPMYRDSLKALGYNNADGIIQPIVLAMPAPGGGGPGLPQSNPQGPASKTPQTKGVDTPSAPTPAASQPAPLI